MSTEGRRHAVKRADPDGYITEAEFKIMPEDGYFRIDILDENGKRANSQAYFINEL